MSAHVHMYIFFIAIVNIHHYATSYNFPLTFKFAEGLVRKIRTLQQS